ncbi:kynureninase [Sphingomonas xanthus]|uniref:Kynureninase n=1 Tax=Sphingomonas xanthus TaxID=2594473 RepID=A0A516ISY5_9SPHN|nr:kynureninase [Sphingomonas xanthus]QDP19997.1 kynureninase [Sphingomonas xanthus]
MTFEDAKTRDAADSLAHCRERFRLPPGKIYLDGNSLGAMPASVPDRMAEVIDCEWGDDLIESWNKHDWMGAPERVAGRLAPLVGAEPDELLITDSTSINLFKLLGAALAARPKRSVILSEEGNFPSDLYVAQGMESFVRGSRLQTVPTDAIAASISDETAVVMLTHIDYRGGGRHDMKAINAAAHRAGALTLWDLSHSAGALAIDLDGDGCDLAVGCGYKYLNGGPGAPAFLFVARHLGGELSNPLPGWMGHAAPFAFDPEYRPCEGIGRFRTGTPSILGITALEAGLATFDGVFLTCLEAKSRSLSELFIGETERRCGGQVRLASPREPEARGSHVVFAHPHGYAVMRALIEAGVVGDFREPDLMRFGFAPLYNSHQDVWRAAEAIGRIIASGEWDQPRFHERRRVI